MPLKVIGHAIHALVRQALREASPGEPSEAEPPSLAGRAAAEDVSCRWPLAGAQRRLVRYAPV